MFSRFSIRSAGKKRSEQGGREHHPAAYLTLVVVLTE
jgi:hypothetical protein